MDAVVPRRLHLPPLVVHRALRPYRRDHGGRRLRLVDDVRAARHMARRRLGVERAAAVRAGCQAAMLVGARHRGCECFAGAETGSVVDLLLELSVALHGLTQCVGLLLPLGVRRRLGTAAIAVGRTLRTASGARRALLQRTRRCGGHGVARRGARRSHGFLEPRAVRGGAPGLALRHHALSQRRAGACSLGLATASTLLQRPAAAARNGFRLLGDPVLDRVEGAALLGVRRDLTADALMLAEAVNVELAATDGARHATVRTSHLCHHRSARRRALLASEGRRRGRPGSNAAPFVDVVGSRGWGVVRPHPAVQHVVVELSAGVLGIAVATGHE
mmetsp:Transcript_70912/g.143630  ORF Transcript_70912/g.143630 Transcript_70912/m.143630 type:complete len:332 (+) Transcript_70912:522-1517(+)